MKICIDCRLISAPGIGTYLKSLIKPLSSDKRFTFFFLCYEKDNVYFQTFGHCIIVKSSIYSLKEQWELPLKIPRCDLFWSPHFPVSLLPIFAKKRLTTIHDLYHLAYFKTLSWKQKIYAWLMYRAAVLYSDCVITVSQFTTRELFHYVKIRPKNHKMIPNGLTLDVNCGERKKYILCVGNSKPHKNLDIVRQAAQSLDLELIIVGKGIHEVTEEKLVMLYKQAALFVFPSLYEGFGYPPLEAMSYGCPVVASNRGSIPEVCGNAAEYIDPLDLESLKQGIINVYYNLERRENLIKEGFSQVKKFALTHTVEEYQKVICESCHYS